MGKAEQMRSASGLAEEAGAERALRTTLRALLQGEGAEADGRQGKAFWERLSNELYTAKCPQGDKLRDTISQGLV